jgi:hypothetical protein
VGGLISEGLADVPGAPAAGSADVGLADLADAPPALRELIAVSYGDATGRVFLISALLSIITIGAVLLIREVALRTESGEQQLRSARSAAAGSTPPGSPRELGSGPGGASRRGPPH